MGAQHGTVGGAEIEFFAAGEPQASPAKDTLEVKAMPILRKNGQGVLQPLRITLNHPYAESADAQLQVTGIAPTSVRLVPGKQKLEVSLPPVQSESQLTLVLQVAGEKAVQQTVVRKPVRPMTVYMLPHSHTDIGYTEIQTDIEKRQVQNLIDGMAAAKRTASYPEGARFIWNVEVLWAADLYLHRLSDAQKAEFLAAVKNGQVVLNGMYLNELTGLCRPEELVRLFRYATTLAEKTGATIDSAMISDVPGYTWGTVTAMAHAGIKYFSTAPNYFDRIGTILREWENKPFYWVGPDGKSRVLVWIPFWGYAMSHRYGKMSPQLVEDFYEGLEKRGYPYDIAHVRWSGHGDNAIPDPAICEFVKEWNAEYASPRFIISGTGEAFRAFEERYGKQLPEVRGDWTPYWEDGAGSSAIETGMNRHSSDRLAQAETLFAMFQPKTYPAAAFEDAWNSVILYSEHTWGAWCSVNEPERKETREQWVIKQSYALAADKKSRDLLAASLGEDAGHASTAASGIEIINTLAWPRTDLVTLSKELSTSGDRVLDHKDRPVPSQRLSTGELVFLATDIPPLASRIYRVTDGPAYARGKVRVEGSVIQNDLLRVRLDEQTGGIAELIAKGIKGNFVDSSGGETLNDYLYLVGDNLADLKRNGPVSIRVGEAGPLVASLIVESPAPGCKKLTREIRLSAGSDFVECINVVDKERMKVKSYMAKEGKESVNFAFPFAVPDGEMLLDLPLGVMRPELDQMPSACKNWFTVGRWADVSNKRNGITWVTLDAPLLQVGGITATLLNSQFNPDVWRKKVDKTQKIYSWAMNNHWGTNYRAYQEGPTVFRFVLRPHRQPDRAEASRFATGLSQPLLARKASAKQPLATPLLRVSPEDVLVTALKPSDDGKAIIVRLFGASEKARTAKLDWGTKPEKRMFLSDTSERAGELVGSRVPVPAGGLVSLRVEFGN